MIKRSTIPWFTRTHIAVWTCQSGLAVSHWKTMFLFKVRDIVNGNRFALLGHQTKRTEGKRDGLRTLFAKTL
jgi:hypothetical protein